MILKRYASIGEYGVLLLAPAILILAAAILLALLGIFVVWLIVFWLLAAQVVTSDLVRRHLRRPRTAFGGFSQGAVPAGQ